MGRAGGARSRRAADGTGDGLGGDQVEGRQAVRELLLAGRRRVHQVLVAESDDGPLGALAELARARAIPVHAVGRGRIDALAATDAPQGVVANADPLVAVDLDELIQPPGEAAAMLVVLDEVTDPHNLGAVMRSALSAGATGVVLGRHRSARLTPSALKAAAGAAEYLPVALVTGIPAALRTLSEAGVWTVGLDADGPTSLWELPVASEAVAIVLGAEGRGLSRLARERCEVVARVPMLGPLDSLNVSATAALACFEVARRRAAASA
ncbi:23S rRNA (guanosine(2251)-2'-O)-methyltransferase RlmB [Acidiferrimicrobium sp. IK]|uniref:23S rRNA (guanosine(2251)-2'-O)-methyltransferase RlmB n=1 Tax=Acidiferrimicrobium sp. IK TaxID=2871700 RepID=UPI0021CB61EE|nr:23S rRNA (guanosine(2251)-2'-O)-methyltransferase RlmB [Acidiferrimicrobium sp. IK]MCU4186965.1 23S rRNA (guanosine(2251)-2'-O)-methyltransferase RlmB [Acidiferrimicrobium sp. IK]